MSDTTSNATPDVTDSINNVLTNGGAKRTRTRKAPYVRVALNLTTDGWQFFESVRTMLGHTATEAVVFSGGQDAINQATVCVNVMSGVVEDRRTSTATVAGEA